MEYNNCSIYELVCLTTGLRYIGSTKKPISYRLSGHTHKYRRFLLNQPNCNYTSSFDILKNNNYKINLLENVSCECKSQLREKENEWIQKIECVNKYNAVCNLVSIQKEYKLKMKNTIFKCNCGWVGNQLHKSNHFKSKKHCEYLAIS